jgi:predicted metal-dependent hydrolase
MTSSRQPIDAGLEDDRLRRAVQSFNTFEWYAAHDGFEELWHESSGDEREALHGMIQVAVAEHHLLNGNLRGSLLLMAEGLNHLQQSSPEILGFNLELLIETVKARLLRLQSGKTLDDLPVPQLKVIRPVDPTEPVVSMDPSEAREPGKD